jgi:predicted nucleic acid-binding protein
MPIEYMTPAIDERVVHVQLALAEQERHRSPSIPDLLIAATAELANLTVFHRGKDFDLIAEITDQATERSMLAPDVREVGSAHRQLISNDLA